MHTTGSWTADNTTMTKCPYARFNRDVVHHVLAKGRWEKMEVFIMMDSIIECTVCTASVSVVMSLVYSRQCESESGVGFDTTEARNVGIVNTKGIVELIFVVKTLI
jgi:hypothetical protein